MRRVTLVEALELTALVALKDPRRRSRYAAQWLARCLSETHENRGSMTPRCCRCFGALGGCRGTCRRSRRCAGSSSAASDRVVDSLAVGGEAVEDLVCGLVPDVGLGVFVPVGDPGADRGDEVADRAVGAAFDPFRGQLGEPALDEIQPGAVGRREVEREARVAEQPALDRRRLVGRGVVEHDVHVEVRRHRGCRSGCRKRRNSSARCRGVISAITCPEATSSAA